MQALKYLQDNKCFIEFLACTRYEYLDIVNLIAEELDECKFCGRLTPILQFKDELNNEVYERCSEECDLKYQECVRALTSVYPGYTILPGTFRMYTENPQRVITLYKTFKEEDEADEYDSASDSDSDSDSDNDSEDE